MLEHQDNAIVGSTWGNDVVLSHHIPFVCPCNGIPEVSYCASILSAEKRNHWNLKSSVTIGLMLCHHSWQAFWRKISYNINQEPSVFLQWPTAPGGKPPCRASSWCLTGFSSHHEALLRPRDKNPTVPPQWCYRPHSRMLQGQLCV